MEFNLDFLYLTTASLALSKSSVVFFFFLKRSDFQFANRIVVKLGTSVVSTGQGEPALGRIASIVEQLCDLKRKGKQILLVTSGSVGIGKQKLEKQLLLSSSLRRHVQGKLSGPEVNRGAYAAAGQIGEPAGRLAGGRGQRSTSANCGSQRLLFQRAARRAEAYWGAACGVPRLGCRGPRLPSSSSSPPPPPSPLRLLLQLIDLGPFSLK